MAILKRSDTLGENSECSWGDVLAKLDKHIDYGVTGIPAYDTNDAQAVFTAQLALATTILARCELADRIEDA